MSVHHFSQSSIPTSVFLQQRKDGQVLTTKAAGENIQHNKQDKYDEVSGSNRLEVVLIHCQISGPPFEISGFDLGFRLGIVWL